MKKRYKLYLDNKLVIEYNRLEDCFIYKFIASNVVNIESKRIKILDSKRNEEIFKWKITKK